uniref:beta-mannosidase n=1 Tax=Strigamia maritima TaxID=126957 RepID=T1J4G7_STRMM
IQVKANVPGGVYTDLQNNNIIGEPLYRFNDINYRWVGLDSWSYSRNFTGVPAKFLDHIQINLLCEGLDTVSQIFINGFVVGNSDNMFINYKFDVKNYLKENLNNIEIRFESPADYAKNQYEIHLIKKYAVPPMCPLPVQNGECHMNFIRKIQSSFSWDWGPAFPSVGIWKNISIEGLDDLKLTDVIVRTKKTNGGWLIDLQMFLTSAWYQDSHNGVLLVYLDSNKVYEKTLKVSVEKFETVQNVSFIVSDVRSTITIRYFIGKLKKWILHRTLDINIEEWWPNGYGNQRLYNLNISYISQTTMKTTSKSLRIGFRTIELIQVPITNATGLTFFFQINGKAIFLKGSNWIPADSFPEKITTTYIRRLLKSAKETHMNALRVWGGGMYESGDFYQIADELGIMLWHDLMYACAMYPNSDNFLSSVSVEVTQQIKRLQHHPSILLWSGNNENEAALMQNWYQTASNFDNFKRDYLQLYISTIKPIVLSLDNTRPFITSSPSNGLESEKEGGLAANPQDEHYGDVHFYIYIGDTWNWKAFPIPRFTSEFGFQSWSSFETLQSVSEPEDWDYDSKFSSSRQHHLLGNNEMYLGILNHMRIPDVCTVKGCNSTVRYKNILYLTQIFQAVSLKTETEHYLRHQNILNSDGKGNTMGALYWQLNDIWQCPSWASLEYGGKWKMAHYFAEKFFAPQLISPFESDGKLDIFLVTNPVIPSMTLRMVLMIYQWKSLEPLYVSNTTFVNKEIASQKLLEISIDELLNNAQCTNRSYCFFYFQLLNDTTQLSSNWLLLSNFSSAQGLKAPNLKVTVTDEKPNDEGGSDFKLEVTTDAVAPFVWLEAFGIQGRFSDNGFLLVNATKTIIFHSWQNATKSDISSSLSINSLLNIY